MNLKNIGEFVSLNQGLAINKASEHLISNRKQGMFILPLLRIADMLENNFTKFVSTDVNKNVIANKDDIIYTRTGQIGLAFRGFNGVVHNNSFIVSLTSNEIDKDYLFTILQTSFFRDQALSMAKNSVQPDLTHSMFNSIKIPIQSLPKQKFISKIYLMLSEKIKINNSINRELELMAKTLYDYWFLQFEFPNEEGKPYKSSGGKMIYNDQLKKEIPEGWKVIELGSLIVENDKSTIQVNEVENIGGIPFFTSGEEILHYSNKMVSGLNIFMSTGGNASIKIYYGDAAYSTDTWCINAGINTLFYYQYLMTIKQQINDNYFDGSGLKHLKKDAFKKILLYIPSNTIVDKYNKIIEKYFQLISKNTLENQELASLRDFLLPLLMNGQVTFKDENEEQIKQVVDLSYMERFNQWKQLQGYAARGEVDDDTLKKIFDAMDEDAKR